MLYHDVLVVKSYRCTLSALLLGWRETSNQRSYQAQDVISKEVGSAYLFRRLPCMYAQSLQLQSHKHTHIYETK